MKESIRMHFNPKGVFRVTITTLHERQIPYHTYALVKVKTARLVIKGISEYITKKEIKQDLEENKIKPTKHPRIIRAIKSDHTEE